MTHLKDSIFVNAPVEKVDDLVRDPRMWPVFMVGLEPPEKITGDGGPGTVVEGSMPLLLGIHVHETTTVTEERHEPDGTHWRWDASGPLPYWLTCHHEPRDGGTLLTSEMEYTMPWGVLGRAADRLFVERMQRRDAHRSLENMKRLLEEPATLAGPAT
jgi:ligand-binding SRPBCC domain-containing protein